jgi:hypothetical protein
MLLRAFTAPHQRRRQLQRVRCPNAMSVRHLLGERSNLFCPKDFVPGGAHWRKTSGSPESFLSREVSLAYQSRKRAPGFNRRSTTQLFAGIRDAVDGSAAVFTRRGTRSPDRRTSIHSSWVGSRDVRRTGSGGGIGSVGSGSGAGRGSGVGLGSGSGFGSGSG